MRNRVSEVLRSTKDLMNSGGRHWIKGDFKEELKNGEFGFCSAGGIINLTGEDLELRVAAMESLLKAIDPVRFEYYQEFIEEENEYYGESTSLEAREDILIEDIAMWNDAEERKWTDVKRTFDVAANNPVVVA